MDSIGSTQSSSMQILIEESESEEIKDLKNLVSYYIQQSSSRFQQLNTRLVNLETDYTKMGKELALINKDQRVIAAEQKEVKVEQERIRRKQDLIEVSCDQIDQDCIVLKRDFKALQVVFQRLESDTFEYSREPLRLGVNFLATASLVTCFALFAALPFTAPLSVAVDYIMFGSLLNVIPCAFSCVGAGFYYFDDRGRSALQRVDSEISYLEAYKFRKLVSNIECKHPQWRPSTVIRTTMLVQQGNNYVNREVELSDWRELDYRNDVDESARYLSQKYRELKLANDDDDVSTLKGKLSSWVSSHQSIELSKPKHILGFESETRERIAQFIAEKIFRVKRVAR